MKEKLLYAFERSAPALSKTLPTFVILTILKRKKFRKKGSYCHLKISSPFLGTHCRIEVNSSELKISVNPEDR